MKNLRPELYVIGNGFDLYCGMNTSFSHFHEHLFKNRKMFLHENLFAALFECAFFERDRNFDYSERKDMLVKYKASNKYWMDVERFLLEFFVDSDFKIYNDVKEAYESIKNNEHVEFDDFEHMPNGLYSALSSSCNKMQKFKNNDFRSYLLFQLNEYEKEFLNYLKLCENQNANAQFDKKELLREIMFRGAKPHGLYEETIILDFNYTSMPDLFSKDFNIPLTYICVHGNINDTIPGSNQETTVFNTSPIIIGYDSNANVLQEEKNVEKARSYSLNKNIEQYNYYFNRLNEKNEYNKIFSKTYRALNLMQDRRQYTLPERITKIVFYGHSLGPQDYSYFQSIFDQYNLYDEDIILEFCYSNYKGKTKLQCKFELDTAIQDLINKYGNTLDNKDHGHNLLHKLILENRILTRYITPLSEKKKPASP